MSTSVGVGGTRRVIVLSLSGEVEAGWADLLHDVGDVRIVRNLDEATERLQVGGFDTLVCAPDVLLALARRVGQLHSDAIFERFGYGVGVVSRKGDLDWANAKLRSYPFEVLEKIRTTCAAAAARLSPPPYTNAPIEPHVEELNVARELFLELTVTPLSSERGEVRQVLAIVRDISGRRRLQERLTAIDAAGRELVALGDRMLAELEVAERLELLEQKVVSIGRNLLHFDHFAIRVLDRESKRLETLLSTGRHTDAETRVLFAEPEGNGIAGYVAATGRSYNCADVTRDPRYLAAVAGARSSLTVPLKLNDTVIGVFNVESTEPAAFSDDDRHFAEMFARHIALALHVLQLLAVERHSAKDQLASDVEAETASPLNRIVCDVTALMDEYTSDPELRERLRKLIEHVETVKRAMHSITEARGVSGLVPDESDADPTISGKRILVADDEEIIRETIAQVLSQAGGMTFMAADGAEAIRMIRAQRFDLIISDIKMPNKNGYEVFSAAREMDATVPVLLTTGFGYDPNHAIVKASREGLNGVLFKPFKVEQLLDQVRGALTAHPR